MKWNYIDTRYLLDVHFNVDINLIFFSLFSFIKNMILILIINDPSSNISSTRKSGLLYVMYSINYYIFIF